MTEFSIMLNTSFSDIVKKYNKFQLSNHTKASIEEGNNILNSGITLLNQLKSYTKALETMLSDCQDFIKEVEEDLSQKPRKEDYVYHTVNGMLSYLGRDLIVKKDNNKTKEAVKEAVKEEKENNIPSKLVTQNTKYVIERILIPEVGYYMKLPIITDIKKIPSMFYWFKGDNQYSAGIYCCIIPGIYTKVPFPEIIDSTKEYNKGKSIKCKYKTKLLCDEQRGKMAKYHDSQIRVCNFAHSGEKIVKIGYPSRCSNIPNFGNPESLTKDIKQIDNDSIKNILMYGLNDIISAAIYFDFTKNIQSVVLDKLATA